jgi:hypothetical protein
VRFKEEQTMTPYSEVQIRDRAYALWEQAGRPEGQDKAFWAMAEAKLADSQEPEEEQPALDPVSAAGDGDLPTH